MLARSLAPRYSYLAAWAGSEHDILAEDNWSYELSRVDTPCGNASCPDNNITTRNSTILPAGARWPTGSSGSRNDPHGNARA